VFTIRILNLGNRIRLRMALVFTISEKLHNASLSGLPEEAGEVEHASLQDEHEPNPLVEPVISVSGVVIDIGPDPLVSVFVARVPLVSGGH